MNFVNCAWFLSALPGETHKNKEAFWLRECFLFSLVLQLFSFPKPGCLYGLFVWSSPPQPPALPLEMKGREGRIVCPNHSLWGASWVLGGHYSVGPDARSPTATFFLENIQEPSDLTCCGQGARRGHIAALGPEGLGWLLTSSLQPCPPGDVIGPPSPAAPHPCDSAEAVCRRSCLRRDTRCARQRAAVQ